MEYLYLHDPGSLPTAWRAFQCFERYGEDVREYARATGFVDSSCEGEVVSLLRKLREQPPLATERPRIDSPPARMPSY